MPRYVAALLLLLCAMLWGLAFVAQKDAMHYMGPLTFSGVRFLIGALVVSPLALREYRRQRARGVALSRAGRWRLVAMLASFFLGMWLQQLALATTTATNAGFITALYVLFTPMVAFLLARTRPHPIVYLCAPLALIGIYLLTGASLTQLTSGEILLLVCSVFWAIQVALLGQLVRETGMPVAISALTFVVTGVLSLAGGFALEQPSFAGIADGWIPILYSGVMSSGVAFTLQAIGQQYVPSANAAIILSSESLFAALSGAILLGERLPPVGYAGAAIIFLAIVLVETVPAWRSRRTLTSPGSA